MTTFTLRKRLQISRWPQNIDSNLEGNSSGKGKDLGAADWLSPPCAAGALALGLAGEPTGEPALIKLWK